MARARRSSASRPAGYRQWELVAIAHESGLDELRAILGNAIALKAYREKVLPFPDGAILAKMAWKYVPFEPDMIRRRCGPRAASTLNSVEGTYFQAILASIAPSGKGQHLLAISLQGYGVSENCPELIQS